MDCMNARMIIPTVGQMQLDLPDPKAWMTRAKVAQVCGVDPATVTRWSQNNVITAYSPQTIDGESPTPLFWAVEVEEIRQARQRLRPAS